MFDIMVDDQLLEAMENWLLTEEESDEFNSAPVQCLKPNQNPQQLFSVQSKDRDIIVRLCNFTGRTPKILRVSDKTAHVVLCEMSNNGKILQLRNGGLGANPISIISGAFDAVMHVAHKNKLDAVLFRFNTSRLKGKVNIVKRVLARMVRRQPKFEVFGQEVMTSKKIAVVVIKRRSVAIDKIKGITLDEALFTKVDSDLGVRYVSKATGESLTKDEAYAASIASEEEKNAEAEQRVAAKSRLTKEELLKAQSVYNSDYINYPQLLTLPPEEEILESTPKTQMNDLLNLKELEKPLSRVLARETTKAITNSGQFMILFKDDAQQVAESIIREQDQYNPLSAEAIAVSLKKLKEILDTEEMKNRITASAIERVDPTVYNTPEHKAMAIASYEAQIRTEAFRSLGEVLWRGVAEELGDKLSNVHVNMPEDIRDTLEAYADDAYVNINAMLTNRKLDQFFGDSTDPDEIMGQCEKMDKAFKNYGVKLDKDSVLYRGMDFTRKMWDHASKQKVFVFRNYLSCSISANIFGGWSANVATAVAEPELADKPLDSHDSVGVAFAISGVDSVPVMPMGDVAFAHHECEVLLHRGIALSFDTVTRASARTDSQETYYIEAHIMNKQELAALQEGEVFDGDALINEGVVKPVSLSEITFAGFLTEAAENKTKSNKASMRQLIADLVDVDAMPRKFRM